MNIIKSKIIAFLLAILILFSSSFVIIDQHYCCGKLVDYSLFGKADKCLMPMPTCELEGQNLSISEDSCCFNLKEFKFSSIFKNSSKLDIDFQQFNLFSNISLFNLSQNVILANNTFHFKNYSPLILTRDILVFVQCFRI